MDGHLVDRIASAIAAVETRRAAVHWLSSFLLAGPLAARRGEVEAARRPQRDNARRHRGDGHARHRSRSVHSLKQNEKCARTGEKSKKGRRCCKGLIKDGAGRCGPPCGVTCQSGCCSGDVCQPGTSDAACGAGGVPCGVCPANQTCQSGSCVCDVCRNGCALTSIQAAIDAAASGATIRICAGRYEENVTVSKHLTLIGAGSGGDPATSTIIDARNNGRVLTVDDGVTSTLQGLRLTRGFRPDDVDPGGAGLLNSGRLTMIGCVVTKNTAVILGGGILQRGPSLTMNDCEVSQNEALSAGGIQALAGTLTMTNCTIAGNTTRGNVGGGLDVESFARARLTGCVISGNSADGSGGGIANSGILTLDGTFVEGNRAFGHGGGVFNDNGGVLNLVTGTSVQANSANPLPGSGGGIFSDATGIVTLGSGSRVSDNVPDNCVGTTC